MRKQLVFITMLLVVYGGLTLLRISPVTVHAQEVFRSNTVCTKVGDAQDSDKPAACAGPSNFQYYCQGDPRWKNNCSLGAEGCAPTSFAMILSSYGIPTTPPQVDTVFQSNGWRKCGPPPDPTHFGADAVITYFKNQGFQVSTNLVDSNKQLDTATAKNYLDSGYLILGAASNYTCGAGCQPGTLPFDHVFVIDAVPSSTTIDIRDPSNCYYSNGQEATSGRIHDANGQFTWQFAVAVKK